MPNSIPPVLLPEREGFGWYLLRHAIAALVYGVIILMLLMGATQVLGNTQQETLKVQRSVACVLALPVNPDEGRDLEDVADCFYREGLEPPQAVVSTGPAPTPDPKGK